MNKTKIEWTDCTLNAIVGCTRGCAYCYARGQAKRQRQNCERCYQFIPHPHLERLERITPRQKPKKIFIDSMWDWNSEGVRGEWLEPILEKIRKCPQHTFQVLSKRPEKYDRFEFPENVWIGTSIATTADCHRVVDLSNLNSKNIKFVSVEPIHEKIDFWFSKEVVDWMIVGAETGRRKDKVIPQPEWICSLIDNARAEKIPLFIKDSIHWSERIQEYPQGLGT